MKGTIFIKNILVIVGAGYIGSHTVNLLKKRKGDLGDRKN